MGPLPPGCCGTESESGAEASVEAVASDDAAESEDAKSDDALASPLALALALAEDAPPGAVPPLSSLPKFCTCWADSACAELASLSSSLFETGTLATAPMQVPSTRPMTATMTVSTTICAATVRLCMPMAVMTPIS